VKQARYSIITLSHMYLGFSSDQAFHYVTIWVKGLPSHAVVWGHSVEPAIYTTVTASKCSMHHSTY